MLANLLVEYCSPTLAGIKTANLFNCQYGSHSRAELAFIIALWNRRLNSKGVSLKVLRFSRGNALIYVYRESLKRISKKMVSLNFFSLTDMILLIFKLVSKG